VQSQLQATHVLNLHCLVSAYDFCYVPGYWSNSVFCKVMQLCSSTSENVEGTQRSFSVLSACETVEKECEELLPSPT